MHFALLNQLVWNPVSAMVRHFEKMGNFFGINQMSFRTGSACTKTLLRFKLIQRDLGDLYVESSHYSNVIDFRWSCQCCS